MTALNSLEIQLAKVTKKQKLINTWNFTIYVKKPGSWKNLKKKHEKTWNFERKSLKNPEKPGILSNFKSSSVKFRFDTKIYHINISFCYHQNYLFLNTLKVTLRYLLNVIILFNNLFYFTLNFKLKIDPKTCTFKNLEEIVKSWKKLPKTGGNPG